MSEFNREQRRQRGLRAEALLADDLLQEAFEGADAECIAAWRAAETPAQREEAWALMAALAKVQQRLRSIMADGTLAQAKIDRDNQQHG